MFATQAIKQIDEQEENDYGMKIVLLLTSNLHIFPPINAYNGM